jgi:hypothetical protein
MLRKGFLHRDISIGNVPQLDPPMKMTPFKAGPPEELMKRLSIEDNQFAMNANLLERVIKEPDECHGFVIDGDMAARLEGYFGLRGTGEISVSMLSCVGESN